MSDRISSEDITVRIGAFDSEKGKKITGSGVLLVPKVVTDSAFILTAKHVVSGHEINEITIKGPKAENIYVIKNIYLHPDEDAAVIVIKYQEWMSFLCGSVIKLEPDENEKLFIRGYPYIIKGRSEKLSVTYNNTDAKNRKFRCKIIIEEMISDYIDDREELYHGLSGGGIFFKKKLGLCGILVGREEKKEWLADVIKLVCFDEIFEANQLQNPFSPKCKEYFEDADNKLRDAVFRKRGKKLEIDFCVRAYNQFLSDKPELDAQESLKTFAKTVTGQRIKDSEKKRFKRDCAEIFSYFSSNQKIKTNCDIYLCNSKYIGDIEQFISEDSPTENRLYILIKAVFEYKIYAEYSVFKIDYFFKDTNRRGFSITDDIAYRYYIVPLANIDEEIIADCLKLEESERDNLNRINQEWKEFAGI